METIEVILSAESEEGPGVICVEVAEGSVKIMVYVVKPWGSRWRFCWTLGEGTGGRGKIVGGPAGLGEV